MNKKEKKKFHVSELIMKKEVTEKLAILITSAFGLIAALAWNDAISTIFNNYFPEQGNIISKLSYAIFVTILAVYLTVIVGKSRAKLNGGHKGKK